MTFVTARQTRKSTPSIPRQYYSRLPQILDVPNLIEVQLNSFMWFQEEGLKQLFQEVSPIKDFSGSRMELNFTHYEFRTTSDWKTAQQCMDSDLTYAAPLYVRAQLLIKATGEIKEQDLFFGNIPIMTNKGAFITSGIERVVVSQLLRSPGVYFTIEEDTASGRNLCHAKLIPTRGAWLEFETSNKGVISVKINGKRKVMVTTLLRAIGYKNDDEILSLFPEDTQEPSSIRQTMDKEPLIKDESAALNDIYRKLRPGDPPNTENARKLVNSLFFDPLRYDLGEVGRYKLNKRLNMEIPESQRALTREDFIEIIRRIILVNNGKDHADDIDHLGNRRVRTVGELMQNQFRMGLLRLVRVAMERMSINSTEGITASALVNVRPVVAAMREFFGGSQLSQFMDQTNPLAELTHKRRLSAMGPGGLSRERAGFDVRDVHFSHYGRICPIETPEGPNIGLIGSLATYGRINRYGFIETPYRKVLREIPNTFDKLAGKTLTEAVKDNSGKPLAKAGEVITVKLAAQLAKLKPRTLKVVPFVSDEVHYLTADKEDVYTIAQANAKLDKNGQFTEEKVEARLADGYLREPPESIEFMDVSPKQIFSVAASLIPFLEHDDANRALMGSNMQRQAVPLICPEAPLVSTGMEMEAARYSGQAIFARNAGTVTSVTSTEITVTLNDGTVETYPLLKFVRTNQGTCINQHPIVYKGDRLQPGDVLADSSATEEGELALGQNVTCAFMSWEGYNYEDAIIISNRLVEKDKFTSIHIEKYEVEARDTKLGPEEITRDIPNIGEESLRELDEQGIVRVGASVGPDDILVGKITPKGETELSAEEKLLRAIFGEKAREVKDTSLRMPHGEWGKVINTRVFTRENGDDLPAGVKKWVQVWVAQRRRVSVGDKLSGRHGNKGVISIIAPVEDMPFLADGTPIDIILNPIGVPSRMNLGQVLETHLGWAAQVLGFRAITPVFDGANYGTVEDALAKTWLAQRSGAVSPDPEDERREFAVETAKAWVTARGFDGEKVFSDDPQGYAKEVCLRLWLEEMGVEQSGLNKAELVKAVEKVSSERVTAAPTVGKFALRDGRSGQPFDQPVTVGNIYIMKLNHLVEDKVHARSTGPYSLISQQPLGGKTQFGGQRFGEMEVWTLEAYGAAHNLQEILTIKSDDVTGRAKTYEAIVKNEDILQPGVPESFKVLVKELQSLGLAIEVINEEKVALAGEMKELAESQASLLGPDSAGLPPLPPLATEMPPDTATEPAGPAPESPEMNDEVSADTPAASVATEDVEAAQGESEPAAIAPEAPEMNVEVSADTPAASVATEDAEATSSENEPVSPAPKKPRRKSKVIAETQTTETTQSEPSEVKEENA